MEPMRCSLITASTCRTVVSGAQVTGARRMIADSGLTRADRLLALYHGAWKGDISRVFTDCAY